MSENRRKVYIATEYGGQIRVAHERSAREASLASWGVPDAKFLFQAPQRAQIVKMAQQHAFDPTGRWKLSDLHRPEHHLTNHCYTGQHRTCRGQVLTGGSPTWRREACQCPCHGKEVVR